MNNKHPLVNFGVVNESQTEQQFRQQDQDSAQGEIQGPQNYQESQPRLRFGSSIHTIAASPPKKITYQPRVSFAGSDIEGLPRSLGNQGQFDNQSPSQIEEQFEVEKVAKSMYGDFRNDSRSLGSGKKSFGGSRSYTCMPFKSMISQSKTKSKGEDDDLEESKANKLNSNSSSMFMNFDKDVPTCKRQTLFLERGMSTSRNQKNLKNFAKLGSVESEKSQKLQSRESNSSDHDRELLKHKNLKGNKKAVRKKSKCLNKVSSIDCEQKGRFLIKSQTEDKHVQMKQMKRKSSDKLFKQESRKRAHKEHGSTSSRKLDFMNQALQFQQIQFQHQMSSNSWQNQEALKQNLLNTPNMNPSQFYMQSPVLNKSSVASPLKMRQDQYGNNLQKHQKVKQKHRDGYYEDYDSYESNSDINNTHLHQKNSGNLKQEEEKKEWKKQSFKSERNGQTPTFPMYNFNDQLQTAAFPDPQQFNQMFQFPYSQPNLQNIQQVSSFINPQLSQMQFSQYICMQQQLHYQIQFDTMARSMNQIFNQMITQQGQFMNELLKIVKSKKRSRKQSSSIDSSEIPDDDCSEENDRSSSYEPEKTTESKKSPVQHINKNERTQRHTSQQIVLYPPLESQHTKKSKKIVVSKKEKELQAQMEQMSKELKKLKEKNRK